MTEITPARLLELAERAEAFAEASLPSDNEERAAFDEEHAAFADALRAAADQIEALTAAVAETDHWVEAFKEQGVRADAAEATLAARDALLGRAGDLLPEAAPSEDCNRLIRGTCAVRKCLIEGGHKFQISHPVDFSAATCISFRARTLAADIAAALGGTDV